MLSIVAAALCWLPALVGLGSALPSPGDPALRRGVAGVLGLGVLGVVVMVVQLALPFGPLASTCAWTAGMALLVLRRRWLLEGLSPAELAGVALAVALSLFWYQAPGTSFDSGLYYLQTVRWITEHPLRLGLGNLHGRLAFNSLWLTIAGGVELPLLAGRGYAFVNLLPLAFLGGLAGVGLGRLVAGGRRAGDAALALLAPVAGHATGGLGAPAPDQAAEVLVVLCLALWIRALEEDDEGFAADALPALLLAVLAVAVKLSTLPLLLLPAFAIAWRRRALSAGWLARGAALGAAVVVPWVARSLLLSGCAVYPAVTTCLADLPWAVPVEAVRSEAAWIRAWARLPGHPASEVLATWGWLPRWAAVTARRSDVRMFGATAGVGLALLAWLGLRGRALLLALGTAVAGTAYVFAQAPDPRFGFGFLHALGLVPLAFALTRLPRGRRAVVGALLVAATAALTLRWARIGHQRTPWRLDPIALPLLPGAEVKEQVNGLGAQAQVPVLGDQCWAAPLPCTPALNAALRDSGGRYAVERRP